jgi:hypothetical protein
VTATAEKLKNGTFKHIESELYCYKETLKEIERLRTELLESGTDGSSPTRGSGETKSVIQPSGPLLSSFKIDS